MKINVEEIKKIMEKGKKIALQRVAPFALAFGVMSGVATPNASAATISFDQITISAEEYASEKEYTSSNLDRYEHDVVEDEMEEVFDYFENVYEILANGGFDTDHMGSKNDSIARLLAHFQEIQDSVNHHLEGESNAVKNTVNEYVKSKINEAKLLYSSYMNISIRRIEEYANTYSCIFAGGNRYEDAIAIYEKDTDHEEPEYVYFNDKYLTDNKTIVKLPTLQIEGKNSPNFYTVYEAKVVSKSVAKQIRDIMEKADELYDNVERAIRKGNYTMSRNLDDHEVMVAIYGDTSVIYNAICQKYSMNAEVSKVIREYMTYRQEELVAQVYKENKDELRYRDFTDFNEEYTSLRTNEDRSKVYYSVTHNGRTTEETIKNKGYLDMEDLGGYYTSRPEYPNTPPTTWFQNITVQYPLNLYVNGDYFYPRDAQGKYVQPPIYNGTTYVPVRAISEMYGADVRYENKTVYVTTHPTPMYDQYGNYIGERNHISESLDRGYGSVVMQRKQATIQSEMGIQIVIDGQLFVPTDANGKVVPVLFYNGTVMVPARALVEKFGGTIQYDASINGVRISDQYTYTPEHPDYPTYPEYPSYPEYYPDYPTTSNNDSFIIGYDQYGNQVNIYIDSNNGEYYILQGNQKVYLSSDLPGYTISTGGYTR